MASWRRCLLTSKKSPETEPMLYIIGTGLESYKDISLKSLEIIKEAGIVYQECYTCIQLADFSGLEDAIGKKVVMADRKMVEEGDEIVENAKSKDVVFLVAGTPLFATTHSDMMIRAKKLGVAVRVVHNTSILNVKGCYGLYSYNFGKTVSIPYFEGNYKPLSFYDNILINKRCGMHTLCLLDIRTDERRFMTANEAIEEMLYAENEKKDGLINENTELLVVCRFATDSELVVFDKVRNLLNRDFGDPLHSLIVPGDLSVIEREFLDELILK